MARFLRLVVVLALLVAACGGTGGGETSTTGEGQATTTEAPGTTEDEDDGQSVGLGDIPRECVEAFSEYLQAIEPLISDIDWTNASLEDLEEFGTAIEPASAEFEAAIANSQCDAIDVEATDEESFEFMIDLAREDAPGTVAYLEFLRDFAAGITDGNVSGDCEEDIAALQEMVDEGETVQQLPAADVGAVGNLVASISANCPPERSAEFFGQEDVIAFMGG